MKNNITELVFILDRSGSMAGLESDTIGGFNSMIEKQKKQEGECARLREQCDDALDVECTVPFASDKLTQYTVVLVDNMDSRENWLNIWKDVEFTSCSYIELTVQFENLL